MLVFCFVAPVRLGLHLFPQAHYLVCGVGLLARPYFLIRLGALEWYGLIPQKEMFGRLRNPKAFRVRSALMRHLDRVW